MANASFLKKTLAGALILTLLPAAGAWAQAQVWAPYFGNTHFGFSTYPDSLPGNNTPSAVRLADLDSDGDLDAVVSQSISGSGFTVLLNSGAGYYQMPVHYASAEASDNLVVGDFTGDGHPDVVVANTGQYGNGTSIALFSGMGNGSFGTDTTFAVGTGPAGLAAADLNNDGHLDLAVANYGWGQDSTVSILLNNGAGAFLPAHTFAVGTAPSALAVGRLDADSLPELVVGADYQHLYILHNLGGGNFQPSAYTVQQSNWAGDTGPAVALADMDADGDLDVLYSSNRTWDGGRGQVVIRHNDGSGVLDSVSTTVNFEDYSTGTSSLVVADLNNDSLPDLVSSSGSGRVGDGYRVMLNLGNETFGPAVVRPAGQWTGVVAVGDVTQDGKPDIVTLDSYSRELTVHRNLNGGEFPSQTLITAGLPVLSGNLEVADLDNDGDLDVVTSSNSRAAVSVGVAVLLNNGNGTFAPGVQIATGGVQVKCRDLNNDGFADLLYAGGTGTTGYQFYTALNSGNGTFAPPVLHNVGVCAPEDIDAADMDGDGDLDVVASSGCTSAVYVSSNLGNGTFGTAVSTGTSSWAGPLAIGDFNEDGRLDVATGVAQEVAVLLGDTVGLASPTNFSMGGAPYDILTADVNDDGHLDIASCNYGGGFTNYTMSLRLGNGDGTFQPLVLLPAAYSPDLANVSGIACGDIDNDYDLDLMVSNNATNDMSVYLNQGGGQFSAALRAGLYYGASSPWFADFNNDGHSEVAALVELPPSGFSNALVILQGTNSGVRTAGTGTVVLGTKADMPAVSTLNMVAAPNPFGQLTNLSLTLPRAGTATLTVYNVLGQEVMQPFRGHLPAGRQTVKLNRGSLPAGTYHVRLVSGTETRRTTVVVE